MRNKRGPNAHNQTEFFVQWIDKHDYQVYLKNTSSRETKLRDLGAMVKKRQSQPDHSLVMQILGYAVEPLFFFEILLS